MAGIFDEPNYSYSSKLLSGLSLDPTVNQLAGLSGLTPRPTSDLLSELGKLLQTPEPTRPIYVGPLITWRGLSGVARDFQIHEIGTPFHDLSGVYIFCRRAHGSNWHAIYIGETRRFKRRLTDELHFHHQIVGIRAQSATHICVLSVPGELALREAIETDLRGQIKTPCNRQ